MHIRSRGLMRGKYNYGHALASAQWTVSFPRQCRTNPVMPPQTAPATGLSRPHDVRQRIVRGQAVGLARRPVKIVGMGLATTNRLFRIGCHLNGIGRVRVAWRDGSRRVECRVCVCSRPVSIPATQYMGMASQLRFCQRRDFHSAGQTFSTAAMRQKTRRS